ncbi:Phage protein [Janthinobacterium sp. CG23_2]|nr:Phage protein [Janthinobacterium sp. CG23_2]CUU28466.1 Phage protein [Janthinobacterium sp. CG23_2]
MITFDTSALLDAFNQLTDKITDAVGEPTVRAAGFAGADVFRDEAKRNAMAHQRTGALARSIVVKRLVEESDGTRQAYLVTVRGGKPGVKGGAFYWRFVEFGTAHSPAQPFLRPAYESKKQAAADAVTRTLAQKIDERLGGQ